MAQNEAKHKKALERQESHLEHLFYDRTYTRYDLMRMVLQYIRKDEAYLTEDMIKDFAANHWDQVADFLRTVLDIDVTDYKENGSFKIPLLDAVSICTYAYMLLKSGTKRQDPFTKKLSQGDMLSIMPSEWKQYNKYICEFLKMLLEADISLEAEFERKCTRKTACSDECDKYAACEKMLSIRKCLQYVEQRQDALLRLRNDIIQSRNEVEDLLECYINDLQAKVDAISEYYEQRGSYREFYQPTLTALVFRYKQSLYDFCQNCFSEIWLTLEKNIGINKCCDSNTAVDFDNNVCRIVLHETPLQIYTADAFESIPRDKTFKIDYGLRLQNYVQDSYGIMLQSLNSCCLLIPNFTPDTTLHPTKPVLHHHLIHVVCPEDTAKSSPEINHEVPQMEDTRKVSSGNNMPMIWKIKNFKQYIHDLSVTNGIDEVETENVFLLHFHILFQNSFEYAVNGLSVEFDKQLKKLRRSYL